MGAMTQVRTRWATERLGDSSLEWKRCEKSTQEEQERTVLNGCRASVVRSYRRRTSIAKLGDCGPVFAWDPHLTYSWCPFRCGVATPLDMTASSWLGVPEHSIATIGASVLGPGTVAMTPSGYVDRNQRTLQIQPGMCSVSTVRENGEEGL